MATILKENAGMRSCSDKSLQTVHLQVIFNISKNEITHFKMSQMLWAAEENSIFLSKMTQF